MMMIRRKNTTPTRDRGAHVEIIDLHDVYDENWVPVNLKRRRFKQQRSVCMMLWAATVFFAVVRSHGLGWCSHCYRDAQGVLVLL